MSTLEGVRRVYIAGPMTGYAEFNFPAFRSATAELRAIGLEVVSPAEMDEADGLDVKGSDGDRADLAKPYAAYMADDLREVCLADAVVVLDGWHASQGAMIEVNVARALGKPIIAYPSPEAVRFEPPAGWAPEPCSPAVSDAPSPLSGPDVAEPVETPHMPGDGRERVTDPTTGGMKERRRSRFDLLPWDALWEVAEVYGHGSEKYDDHNWRRGYDWSLSIGALGRHLAKLAAGEDIDPESGLPHAAHAAFHCLALLTFRREHAQGDDRAVSAVPPWSAS